MGFFTAVSYTHLDVYKRQREESEGNAEMIQKVEQWNHNQVSEINKKWDEKELDEYDKKLKAQLDLLEDGTDKKIALLKLERAKLVRQAIMNLSLIHILMYTRSGNTAWRCSCFRYWRLPCTTRRGSKPLIRTGNGWLSPDVYKRQAASMVKSHPEP